jgi:hypothetical protein
MAFHPFRMFRKHQKAWLAGITIMAMFSFVFCSGGVDTVLRLFGGRWAGRGTQSGSESEITKLYGKPVTRSDVQVTELQRTMANLFMANAVGIATNRLVTEINEAFATADSFFQRQLQMVLQNQNTRSQMFTRFAQFITSDYLDRMQNEVRRDLSMLDGLQGELDRTQKTELAAKIQSLRVVLQKEAAELSRPRNEVYFGGTLTRAGCLDFMIWQHEADKLGIRLDDDALKAEIKRETHGLLKPEDAVALQTELHRQYPSMPADALQTALRDEFRVRMAKQALVGYEPGAEAWKQGTVNDVPASLTPYDFWKFYRDNRTTIKVALLPVPVDKFVGQVAEKPTEVELKRLFNQYKEQEPSPEREKPGFKEPRRVKIEWLSGSADSLYYQKVATLDLDLTRALLPGYLELALLQEYDFAKSDYRLPPLGDPNFALAIYTMKPRATNVAAAVGEFLGCAGTGALGFNAAYTYQAGAYAQEAKNWASAVEKEAKDRAVHLARILANTDPFTAAAALDAANRKDRYLPFDAVKDLVLDRMRHNAAQRVLFENVETVRKELLAKRSKPEEVKAYIEKVVKELGFSKHAQTEKLRDRFDIGDDPALKPLKDEYLRQRATDDPRGRGFANMFFSGTASQHAGLYDGQEMSSLDSNAPILYWRTEDKPAYVPKFDEVKAKVEAAWKFQKARALAKKAADDLAAKAKDAKAEATKVLTEEAYKHPDRGLVFELDNVALLLPKKQPFEAAEQYEPYRIPETQIAYPRPNMLEKFLALREPGETLVTSDRPDAIYYVVALVKRAAPSEREFYDLYRRTPTFDTLRARLEQERREDYVKTFLSHLRAEAGEVDSEGNLVVAEDPRKGADSRSDEG